MKEVMLWIVGTILITMIIIVGSGWIANPKLLIDVSSAPYSTSDYESGVFDCSNMAATLHNHLKKKGYEVTIHEGYVTLFFNDIHYHAWVVVDNTTIVESTSKAVITFSAYQYNTSKVYSSVDEANKYSKGEYVV